MVPLVVQSWLDELRAEIDDVAEPGRDLLAEIEYLLARESSSLRGFVITGDSSYIERYEGFAAREREIFPELEEYASDLSPSAAAAVATLRAFSEQWHERVVADPMPIPSNTVSSLFEQELHYRTLDAATRADLVFRTEILGRMQEIREVERLTRAVYSLLLVMAIGAAMSVALLNFRIRRLAEEADQRRRQVEKALEDTARAVQGRASLIRGFTHDVKNPLGAADGYAELLEAGIRGAMSPEQVQTVQRIRRSIRGAIEIIEELLDLSRLESGGLSIRRQQTDIADLVEDLAQHHDDAARAKGLELSFEAQERGSGVAYTDPDRVRQILENLLSNARKYTPPPGRIALRVWRADGPVGPRPGSWVVVSVADTGPGIPEQELDRIFDEFHRVPGTLGSGHGLGLSISRGIARLLGGDILVRSMLGEGSEFQLWLPVRTPV